MNTWTVALLSPLFGLVTYIAGEMYENYLLAGGEDDEEAASGGVQLMVGVGLFFGLLNVWLLFR